MYRQCTYISLSDTTYVTTFLQIMFSLTKIVLIEHVQITPLYLIFTILQFVYYEIFAHIYIWCIPHVLGKKPNEIFRNVNSANHGNTLNYWFSGVDLNDLPVAPLADAGALRLLPFRFFCRPVTITVNDFQKGFRMFM